MFRRMFAHILGAPIEESLPWLISIAGLGVSAIAGQVRAWLPGAARRSG